MKAIIIADQYEHARMVAQHLQLELGEWKFAREQFQLHDCDGHTKFIVYDTALEETVLYLKRMGWRYSTFGTISEHNPE